jgi:hypothetical protein
MLASRIIKSWLPDGTSSGNWIALLLALWLAGTTMRSLSQRGLSPADQCSWDYWHGWFNPGVRD